MEMENICEISIDSLEEDRSSDNESDQPNLKDLGCPNYLSAVNICGNESTPFTCINKRRQKIAEEKHLRNYRAVSTSGKGINDTSTLNFSPDHSRLSSKGALQSHETISSKSAGRANVTPPVNKIRFKCKNLTSANVLRTKNASYLQMFQEKIGMKELEMIGKNKHKSAPSSTKSSGNTQLPTFSSKRPLDVGRDYISSCERCCSSEGRSYQNEISQLESQLNEVFTEKSEFATSNVNVGLKKETHMPCSDESPLLRCKSRKSNNIPTPEMLERFLKRCSYGNSASERNRMMLLSKINSQKILGKKTETKNLSPSEKYEPKKTIALNRYKQKNSQKVSGKDHKDQTNLNLKILQERHQREVLLAKQIQLEVFKNC